MRDVQLDGCLAVKPRSPDGKLIGLVGDTFIDIAMIRFDSVS